MIIKILQLGSLTLILLGCVTHGADKQSSSEGKRIAFERTKGNCLACHAIADGAQPGNIGQPLVNIASHFKDKDQLRSLIWDATRFNSDTTMPPFGRNKILTEAEIDSVVEYLWSLE